MHMKIFESKKILLALILCCLTGTGIADAADRIVNPDAGGATTDEITGQDFTGLPNDESVTSGGAIYNEGAISQISASTFTENTAVSEDGSAYGGAIYNTGTINSIMGNSFSGNSAEGSKTSMSSVSYGGAIYNSGEIDGIAGCDFIDNSAVSETQYGEADGGAVYNSGAIGSITDSNFTKNTANRVAGSSSEAGGSGGAIYNSGTIGSIVETTFDSNVAGSRGGAINNVGSGSKIESIADSVFTGNEAAEGGAISNNSGTINEITNNTFKGNTATSGGAIYNNNGTIEIITGSTFSENSATNGGAIYLGSSGTVSSITESTFVGNEATNGGAIYFARGSIESIIGSCFDGNSATSNGGAIYIARGTIESIVGSCFYDNSATSNGGAIYITSSNSTIDSISESTFEGNTAGSDGGAIYNTNSGTISEISGSSFSGNNAGSNGGAIYNAGTISSIKNTSFTENSATKDGGAIYTTSDLTIVADGADVVFSGNSAGGEGDAIYMASSAGTVNFELSNGGSIYLYDSVSGETGYGVGISGDGTFYLLNDLEGAALSVGSADGSGSLTLNTVNGEVHSYSVSSFTLAGDINMQVDVDLASGEMDTFKAGSYTFASDDTMITITGMNFINEGSVSIGEESTIYFSADSELGSHISVSESAATAYTPIYLYNVTSGTDENGLYFSFLNAGNNPAVLASSVSQMALYGAMNMMFSYNFEHSDYFMKLPSDLRLAKGEQDRAKKSSSKVKENDPKRIAYYNQHEMANRGAWFRSFAANESVSYRGGLQSRDKYWGGLVGLDSSLREHGDGWASVFTGYIGTIGIRQSYSGGHIKQHGALIGVTESFYKKNFYTAWTAAAGFTRADEHTMYGREKSRNNAWGVAGKFGWNIEFAGGKFALLPTFTASYSTVDPEDYVNGADVNITGSGLRAVQLNPNVKFIVNLRDGWQPYLTVGEVWTVGQSSSMQANGDKLEEPELKAYTEYGIGVQKRWAASRDAFAQVLGHSGGRDGILVNAGIRWNF